ncbi:zinc-ribbon domain-containing protein [bacterium]|nr:MAG: zinc-ribbon domain-containing protein [bacterium]
MKPYSCYNLNMFQELDSIFIILTTIALAFILAVWISLIIWTIRDIRQRTKDGFFRFLAVISVIIFNFPGFLIYLILRPKLTFAEYYQTALEEEALLQSIEGFDTCPNCGHQTKPTWKFCPFCTTELGLECEKCGEFLRPDWIACPQCGTTISSNLNADGSVLQESGIEIESLNESTNQDDVSSEIETNSNNDSLFLEEEEFDSFQDN